MEKGNEKKTKGKEELDIAYQNKDITSKILAEEFKGKSFAVYGVDIPKIVSVEPTNLPAIEANELRMDNLFLLEDGSYLLVDYESAYDEANKVKYLGYVVRVSQRLYNKNPILDVGCNKFEITEAFLSEIDSETVWQRVSGTISSGKLLDSTEVMELIIYPLSFPRMEDKQQAVGDMISLVSKLEDERTKRFVLKCLLVFADKIIKDEDSKRIKEVFMIRYSEIETKIIQGAKEDGAKEIAKNLLRNGFDIDSVAMNTNLPKKTIKKLLESVMEEKNEG